MPVKTVPKGRRLQPGIRRQRPKSARPSEKGHRFFAQVDANDGNQYRYLLQNAKTVPEAQTARQVLKDLQRKGELFPPKKEAWSEPEQKEGLEPATEPKNEGLESRTASR